MHAKPTAFLSGIPFGVITGILEELQPEKTLESFWNSSKIPLTSFSLAKFRPVESMNNKENLGPLFLFAAFDL